MPICPDVARAADFIARTARLVDRVRFAHRTAGGSADAVVAAVRAYQNPDGGFGNALEPDLRTATSQPGAVRSALEMLHEVDRVDGADRICDFLASISVDGGLPFATAAAARDPRAPWWQIGDHDPPSPVFTAPIAGILHAHRVGHPWLAAATAYVWREIDGFDPPPFRGAWDLPRIGTSYTARALLLFLQHLPDRDHRVTAAIDRLCRLVIERGLVELDPDARGEVHGPLDHAPAPGSPMRGFFDDAVIEAHLDARVRAQDDDGGWHVTWAAWNPMATLEWRGWATVETLALLGRYGRVRLQPRS